MPRPQDVIVIGAGIVGCAIAYELARREASVQIVDQRSIGMGATQASAGILAPYIEAGEAGPLLDLTVRSLRLFDDFVTRVSADSGIAIPYQRTGTLQVALTADAMATLTSSAAALASRRVESSLLDSQSVHDAEPSLGGDVVGGLLVPSHGFVAAGELTHALAAAARRHGTQIVEGRTVRRIAGAGSGVLVETDRGSFGGAAVILAAGSWSPQVEIAGASIRPPVHPIRGQLLRLAWTGPRLGRTIWGDRCYLVPWDDGTLLVGATVEDVGYNEHATVGGVRQLMNAACELLPRAPVSSFLGARAGLRPATQDELPIIGPSQAVPGLMYATGHYRNGVLLAPLTAELVADAVLDDRSDPLLSAVSPRRFGVL
jgi:glycine oxidase